MLIRKIAHTLDVNRLNMDMFQIYSVKDQEMVLWADDGYPEFFRVELKFSGLEYLACPVYFHQGQLRVAAKQEPSLSKKYSNATIFCFEADPVGGKFERYFIVARDLGITVHFGGTNLDFIEDLLEPLEKSNGNYSDR